MKKTNEGHNHNWQLAKVVDYTGIGKDTIALFVCECGTKKYVKLEE